MDIYIYIFTKIVSLHLNFLYLLPLNPLILRSFTSTNKLTPCIRFQIEDCSFSKIQIRGKLLFIFYNFAKLESSLTKTKPRSFHVFLYLLSFWTIRTIIHFVLYNFLYNQIPPVPLPSPILFHKFDTWQGLISTGSPHKLCNIDRRSGVTSCSNFVFSLLPFPRRFPKTDVRDVDLSCTPLNREQHIAPDTLFRLK